MTGSAKNNNGDGYLKAKFQIGSCKGPTNFQVSQQVFHPDDVPPEKARKHGHIHIEDIPKEEGFFENEHLVIMHVSARHSTARAQEIIEDQLPQYLQDKITLIPNSFSSIID